MSLFHEFVAGAADSMGPLRGVPRQGGVATGTHVTRHCTTVAAVVLEGERESYMADGYNNCTLSNGCAKLTLEAR